MATEWTITQGKDAFDCPIGGEKMALIGSITGMMDMYPSSVGVGVWRCPVHGEFMEDGYDFWRDEEPDGD